MSRTRTMRLEAPVRGEICRKWPKLTEAQRVLAPNMDYSVFWRVMRGDLARPEDVGEVLMAWTMMKTPLINDEVMREVVLGLKKMVLERTGKNMHLSDIIRELERVGGDW